VTINEITHECAKRHERPNYAGVGVSSLSRVVAAAHATPFDQPGDVIPDERTVGAADARMAVALHENPKAARFSAEINILFGEILEEGLEIREIVADCRW
jgi:hypothetical protein